MCRQTVTKWLKKTGQLSTTLLPPPPAQRILELDELWSFVHDKKHQCWVWIALCAVTRQVVAFVTGDRGEKTCKRLWRAVPWRYKRPCPKRPKPEAPKARRCCFRGKRGAALGAREVLLQGQEGAAVEARQVYFMVKKRALCYSDFWAAYKAVIPSE